MSAGCINRQMIAISASMVVIVLCLQLFPLPPSSKKKIILIRLTVEVIIVELKVSIIFVANPPFSTLQNIMVWENSELIHFFRISWPENGQIWALCSSQYKFFSQLQSKDICTGLQTVKSCCVTYSGLVVWIKFSAPEVEQYKLSVCGYWW